MLTHTLCRPHELVVLSFSDRKLIKVSFLSSPLDNLEIIAGELDTSDISGIEQTAKISNLTIHPDYDSTISRENNICLLYLTEDFEINDKVKPIELQSTKPTSTVCITSGWGSFEVSTRVLHPI